MYYCVNCRDRFGWPMGKNKEENVCDMCQKGGLCFRVSYKYAYPPKYDSDPEAMDRYTVAKDKELEEEVESLLT